MSLVPFLRTPAHIETSQKQQPKSTAATTQERPAVQAEPQWQSTSPASDDEFVISMSQTYERTQPEPCCDYGSAEREEVELSLRRTQPYHAAGSTQNYGQHHHDLLIATAAAALDNPDAAVVTSTADAWEASVAQASALGVGSASAATVLLPHDLILEGQGSNQPGHLAAIMAAAAVGTRGQSRTGSFPSADILRPLPSALPAGSSGPAQTPELQGSGAGGIAYGTATDDIADDGTTPPLQVGLPLFPIFTQGRARRRPPIHLIRHGESEFNLACKRRGGFGDPHDIFDARLTATGEKQPKPGQVPPGCATTSHFTKRLAKALRPQLLDLMQQHGDPLFIVSPLSRAIETFLLMLPDPERLRVCPQTPPPPPSASMSSSQKQHGQSQPQSRQQQGEVQGTGTSCTPGMASKPVNMVICPLLSEFLLTSGDVGRPRSALIESYPQIAEQLRKGLDNERWWYENTIKGPNCAVSKVLNSTEPDKSAKTWALVRSFEVLDSVRCCLQARVDRFRQFVFSQSHRPIVVVGHANFFKSLTHDSHYMSNCQMMAWAP
ncbi:phosphoglycerate mutase-like protein [Volvox carteri f. nagariensis]|uniref:Phosphoglycerate mutase-like protein n=1 Tax=Volvox carteri f. nagariensis TaxID=3068 RepID=D8THK4_VOLCA|nr:phosphoglycerate mutase-like protein [Volvox carteri f. nagariensis]EFJ52727.1 phosphoglycerate mutase-like protein [Volvox carteri f. nagariensis]|eukprot:XP_002945732.1 phosphoglycerate mutase-like protein [Volvox carteri f. nagariensis]